MQRWGLAAIQFSPCAHQKPVNATLTGTAKHLALGSGVFPHTHTHTCDCQTFTQKASLAFFSSFPRATESWDVARGERGAAVSEWTPVSCSARKFLSGYTGAARASEGSDSLQLPLRYSKAPSYHSGLHRGAVCNNTPGGKTEARVPSLQPP